jgi:hypothetical protein
MKTIATTIVWTAVAAAMFFAGRGCGHRSVGGGGFGHAETRVDTLVVRDTVRDTVLVAVERRIVRIDTVWLAGGPTADFKSDTVADSVRAAVPIERTVYATDDYRAVVEGFRPTLVEMELHPRTLFVTKETTRTLRPSRWGVGIQAGWGFSPKGVVPYIGVGIQYSIIEW